MSDPSAYSQACSMRPDQATRVSQMIESRVEFSAIRMTVNSDRKTYDSSLARQVPEGNVLVTFCIPRSIHMPDFYGEFSKALNQELPMVSQRERER